MCSRREVQLVRACTGTGSAQAALCSLVLAGSMVSSKQVPLRVNQRSASFLARQAHRHCGPRR